jgi:predicted nucleic acid-binding protein
MIGLDTNVLLRYLLQDDPKQTRQANQIFERQLNSFTKQNLALEVDTSFPSRRVTRVLDKATGRDSIQPRDAEGSSQDEPRIAVTSILLPKDRDGKVHL